MNSDFKEEDEVRIHRGERSLTHFQWHDTAAELLSGVISFFCDRCSVCGGMVGGGEGEGVVGPPGACWEKSSLDK